MKLKTAGLIVVFFLSVIPFVYAADKPSVEIFSPQGTVKGVRQVTVRFSAQMVPFGDPRGLIEPFEIDCPEKGTGRWADAENWVFDFERDLPAGVQCTFRLKSGLKTLAGKEIEGQKEFSFSTGGPAIKNSIPYEGSRIDEEQIFILSLDAAADTASVLKKVFFSVEGIEDHIGIKIIEGKEREDIVKARFRYQVPPHVAMILIQCKQRFPAKAKVSLVWGRGVMSKTGVAISQDQILRFQTREPFTVTFNCERENPHAGCIPMLPMTLYFSAPISKEQAQRIVLKNMQGKVWKPDTGDETEDQFMQHVSFPGPFPEGTNFKIELPPQLKDDAGRPLINSNKFPLSVHTDKYPPLAKFAARFGVLELKADPVLPVTLRNLEPEVKARMLKAGKEQGFIERVTGKVLNIAPEQGDNVQEWLRRVASAARERSLFSNEKGIKDFKIPKPAGPRAFEVVGIPLKEPGLYIVELESAILGSSLLHPPRPLYVPAAVLVTNLSVHFKWGRESSLVWVTALDTGEPVRDASVTVKDCQEKVLWKGRTNVNGIARIEGPLPTEVKLARCNYKIDYDNYSQLGALSSLDTGFFIMAQTAGDMAFVHSSWDEGIEPWRYQLPQDYYADPSIAHTVFDRQLLRAGETVHMKHLFRQHTMKGFSTPPKDRLPNSFLIEHYGSEERYEFPLVWDANGVAETQWQIPQGAKLGNYGVVYVEKRKAFFGLLSIGSNRWRAGEFRVEEFRVPLLKGIIKPPAEPLINAKEVPLDVSVQYLAGGGAGLLPAKLRSEIRPKQVTPFEGFDEFVFGNGPVKEGIVRRGEPLEYDEEGEGEGEEAVRGGEKKAGKIPSIDLVLDQSGSARTLIPHLPKLELPQEILAELEFRDPNGEIQTVSSRIPLWPSRYLIGIKPDSWAASQEAFKFHVAVLDLAGKPIAGAPVKVNLFESKTYTHRKRLVGGFYAYEHSTETKRIALLCEGKTDAKGLLICEVKSPVSGNVLLQAESSDAEGRRTMAHQEVWVAGKGEWWFEVTDNDRIDLLPEKKRYEPGEVAVFQVRMPFRNATALITVEREGVLEAWVKQISGKEPVIEVPIRGLYAPNVFVSALVVRGRAPGIKPTAMVDLGRPAYKLGIAEIKVGWKTHELKVSVSPDRKVYKVRGKAKVRIKVKTADGKNPPRESEVALAAVDEGLLELMPNRSWDILTAMMGQRGYEVHTATAQMQVIGKRHFGLKALPPGGGGGKQPTRELFDTLLLWKGRVLLDANGEAGIEVPLNDSLTSFRIVAVAQGGAGLFGTGSASIQTTQDLMVLSGLPPLVREGDRFKGEFTIRNTTNRRMSLDVAAKVDGISGALPPVALVLQPGEAQEVGWEVSVPIGVEKLGWAVEVKEKGAPAMDRIKVQQRVVPATPISTFQATIVQITKDYRLFVERPQDALANRGGVRVTLRPRISEGLSGVVDYMKSYPYTCMEQKISIAVALRNERLWKRWIAELPSHLDSDGLVKYFPTCLYGSPILTSYIIAIGNEAGWGIPDEAREEMEDGLKKFIEGSIARYSPLPTADLSIQKLSAIEALSRGKKAEARLLGSIAIDPNLWPTSAVIDWFNILHNVEDIPKREERIKEAEQIVRSRLNFQGTRMGFSTEGSDHLWWLMVSADVNAVRLILSLLPEEQWKADMPRLVLGALARQRRGAWDLTLANAWGVLAIEKFAKAFEAIPVSGTTRTTLSGQTQATDWNALPKGKVSLFAWPTKKADVAIAHQGKGNPWATIQSLAAIPLKEPLSSGYKVKKTISPVEQRDPKQWSRGDIFRIRLEIEAQADQTWVVVSDPVPAGTTILGKGLARDSEILTKGEQRKGWVWPTFEERSFEAFRAYYEYVPKGNWQVEYTVRLNQSGRFQLPTTRVEALYFPEMFGEIPNKTIEVQP
ncbi:MAG: alpha-2-macroglobulin [Deltaproteobacteria bacterium RBG_16_54_11]|nr:MAG: alpha-2-macroglobulin [Deltaproteobacteria bacterium RBG_16_54_11]